MGTNTLNIRGTITQGGNNVTSGYVRVKNQNRNLIQVVRIGVMDTGESPPTPNFYDLWWRADSPEIVADQGDTLELAVYSLTVPNAEALLADPVTYLPTIPTQTRMLTSDDLSVVVWNIAAAADQLPGIPVIVPEDKETEPNHPINPNYTNKSSPYWTWLVPSDPEGYPIHFKIEWSTNPSFSSGVGTATTQSGDALRGNFYYEANPGMAYVQVPVSGVPATHYGVRCHYRMSFVNFGSYYWRVSATDNVNR